jgi:hypothetical protein
VLGSDDRPLWKGDAKALDGWNVFWQPSGREVSTGADRLTNWLQRNPKEAHSEAFRVLVATAPRKPNQTRIGFKARPTPEGCELVPSVELVQRVLREVFGVSDPPSPPLRRRSTSSTCRCPRRLAGTSCPDPPRSAMMTASESFARSWTPCCGAHRRTFRSR